ncbi:NAD(P)H-dependent glycerol-3-phosphate dehydrogenase [Acinetobacter puyangensis]|uniref:Glycerol-3-phosphate dehydrogenase [NAD(P)+] n=1 Tax=Acinetobacter puyangensis TaxID=1096779 RepID=A0A240E6D7_9GAMM|nr:NAD(P)H-dependent glycerol-3-phosphate dehydrogenase [Acinetobacter puyangensis]SNX44162.1 glycerol 3-phosphate dehydrogenase (NAD(P)+) [Acinetobacter puyangensis]
MSQANFTEIVQEQGLEPEAKPHLRVTVLGGGSFGTAMANLAARNGCDTMMWIRDAASATEIQNSRVNKRYLPDFTLEQSLKVVSDLELAIRDRDIILIAIPSHAFRHVVQQIAPMITAQVVVSLTKGIEKDTFYFMSDIIRQELPEVPYGVLSGPNLAKEIMQGMPAGTVIASHSEQLRVAVQHALHSALFRVFASDDVHGVELGGALKNIYAVAMGMGAAYNVGENSKSMLITRALAEMSRFAVKLGANPLTFLGLSGVGDLFATCNSPLSRNYQVGYALGQGKSLQQAVEELGQTAEGINTIVQVRARAEELDVYMPITCALYEVIFEHAPPLNVALSLMKNGNRSDVEFVLPHQQLS